MLGFGSERIAQLIGQRDHPPARWRPVAVVEQDHVAAVPAQLSGQGGKALYVDRTQAPIKNLVEDGRPREALQSGFGERE